jgi:hypothetical protein
MNPDTYIDGIIYALDNVEALLAGSLEHQDLDGVRIAAEIVVRLRKRLAREQDEARGHPPAS